MLEQIPFHILVQLSNLFTENSRPFTPACGSDSRGLNLGMESIDDTFFWVALSDKPRSLGQ